VFSNKLVIFLMTKNTDVVFFILSFACNFYQILFCCLEASVICICYVITCTYIFQSKELYIPNAAFCLVASKPEDSVT